jgi:hypothetical protein
MTERTKNRLGFTAWAAASVVVWFRWPEVMAALLLGLLVCAMTALSVAALLRLARTVAKRGTLGETERMVRVVSKHEPRWHHWQ